jgi:cytoskeleton protein RodZ
MVTAASQKERGVSMETDMPVGEILRRTRIHYKQSVSDVERALRIRAIQIEAIESGDLSQLPGRVYAIGFVRSYSEYLGLDSERMVELFKTQAAGSSATPELKFPVAAADAQTPSFKVVLWALSMIVFVIVGWTGINITNRKTVEAIPQAPTAPQSSDIPSAAAGGAELSASQQEPNPVTAPPQAEIQGPPAPPAAQQDTAAQERQKNGIILNIVENSWVEIKDQTGATILSRVLQAGDLYFVPDRPDLTISLGNSGGVRIEIDGKALKPIGKTGEVRRAIPLDVAYLKKTYAVEAQDSQAPTAGTQNPVENPQ